jgi:hypothetical protein
MKWASVSLPNQIKKKVLRGAIVLKEWMRDNCNTSHRLQQQRDLHPLI